MKGGYLLTLVFAVSFASAQAQQKDRVDRFYRQRDRHLFWFSSDSPSAASRTQLLRLIDSAAWLGLDSLDYDPALLRRLALEVTQPNARADDIAAADRRFTEAALALAADCWRGRGEHGLKYDGVSPRFAAHDDSLLVEGLARCSPESVSPWIRGLEPVLRGYIATKQALARSLDSGARRPVIQLAATLNTIRFVRHFHFDRFIVVNIAAAMLYYFSGDTLTLTMRIVAGQPAKRTPRFAAWCEGLVLYPYWNVPRKIALNEFLPMLRRFPDLASFADFEVLDANGSIVDASMIDWKAIHPGSFNYSFRQTPGCENALGVLKFELTDPFDVYMHDTNFKKAFGQANRYLSHGCIRLEQAARLGSLLLDHRLDTALLAACLRDQHPRPVHLARPVPVFVVYLTAVTDTAGALHTHQDVYHLLD